MKAIGTVLIRKNLQSKVWPDANSHSIVNNYDLEAEYKKALAGNIATVLEISNDKKDYLVLSKSYKAGDFIWQLESIDILAFIPVIKQNGQLVVVSDSKINTIKYELEQMLNNPEFKKIYNFYTGKTK